MDEFHKSVIFYVIRDLYSDKQILPSRMKLVPVLCNNLNVVNLHSVA